MTTSRSFVEYIQRRRLMDYKSFVRQNQITMFTVTIQPSVRRVTSSETFHLSDQDWRPVAPRRILRPYESRPGRGLGNTSQQRSRGPTVYVCKRSRHRLRWVHLLHRYEPQVEKEVRKILNISFCHWASALRDKPTS
jgi:hypothetical protein